MRDGSTPYLPMYKKVLLCVLINAKHYNEQEIVHFLGARLHSYLTKLIHSFLKSSNMCWQLQLLPYIDIQ